MPYNFICALLPKFYEFVYTPQMLYNMLLKDSFREVVVSHNYFNEEVSFWKNALFTSSVL